MTISHFNLEVQEKSSTMLTKPPTTKNPPHVVRHLHHGLFIQSSRIILNLPKMTRFRPCIDLHAGSVKQIVGGTLSDSTTDNLLKTNFTSTHPSAYYAELYKTHDLRGSHVIMLGPGNDEAAREALKAWPHGLQVGGGINDGNAAQWVELGAEKVSLSSLRLDLEEYASQDSVMLTRRVVGHHNIILIPKWSLFVRTITIRARCAGWRYE